jgi:hypothetical protein
MGFGEQRGVSEARHSVCSDSNGTERGWSVFEGVRSEYPTDFAELTRSIHIRAMRSLSLDEPDVDAARQDEKRGAAESSISLLIGHQHLSVFFNKSFVCLSHPIEVEQDRLSETDTG